MPSAWLEMLRSRSERQGVHSDQTRRRRRRDAADKVVVVVANQITPSSPALLFSGGLLSILISHTIHTTGATAVHIISCGFGFAETTPNLYQSLTMSWKLGRECVYVLLTRVFGFVKKNSPPPSAAPIINYINYTIRLVFMVFAIIHCVGNWIWNVFPTYHHVPSDLCKAPPPPLDVHIVLCVGNWTGNVFPRDYVSSSL